MTLIEMIHKPFYKEMVIKWGKKRGIHFDMLAYGNFLCKNSNNNGRYDMAEPHRLYYTLPHYFCLECLYANKCKLNYRLDLCGFWDEFWLFHQDYLDGDPKKDNFLWEEINRRKNSDL